MRQRQDSARSTTEHQTRLVFPEMAPSFHLFAHLSLSQYVLAGSHEKIDIDTQHTMMALHFPLMLAITSAHAPPVLVSSFQAASTLTPPPPHVLLLF